MNLQQQLDEIIKTMNGLKKAIEADRKEAANLWAGIIDHETEEVTDRIIEQIQNEKRGK